MKKKIIINMLSSADKVPGQGVGSAYLELVRLLTRGGGVKFDIRINAHGKADINHFHTVDPQFFLKMKASKAVNVVYCHFLPDTLDAASGSPGCFLAYSKDMSRHFIVLRTIWSSSTRSSRKNWSDMESRKKEWSISPTMSVKQWISWKQPG